MLYLKDKSLLRLFLVVINNANETSANLNLNFIDLVFQTEGNEKDKINLLKEFNKTAQNNNILFFYSIKFMIQNKFENILYTFPTNEKRSEGEELSFIVNYIQFFLEIFYKKEFIKWEEFEDNESIHLRDYEYNLDNNDDEDIPDKAKPLSAMIKPSTITSAALTFIILCVNFLLRRELTAPRPNISGTVPRLKKNMDRAPVRKLPVPRA